MAKFMFMPWDKHKHKMAKDPDEEGDYLCVHCGLVMKGPGKDEADEIMGLLRKMTG